MDKISHKITYYVIKDTELEYEVIKYGVDATLSTALCFSTAVLICALLNNSYFGILFIVFLTPVKMQFIGFHCSSMGRCIATYSSCVVINLLLYNIIPANFCYIYVCLYYLILISITLLVKKELNKHKKKSFSSLLYYRDYGFYL